MLYREFSSGNSGELKHLSTLGEISLTSGEAKERKGSNDATGIYCSSSLSKGVIVASSSRIKGYRSIRTKMLKIWAGRTQVCLAFFIA